MTGNEERKSGVNANQLITIRDLEKFKEDMLLEIRRLLKEAGGQPSKKWLKSREVRKILEVSPGKLQTMRNSGVIAFMKIGGSIYYDRDDINKMFESKKVGQNQYR